MRMIDNAVCDKCLGKRLPTGKNSGSSRKEQILDQLHRGSRIHIIADKTLTSQYITANVTVAQQVVRETQTLNEVQIIVFTISLPRPLIIRAFDETHCLLRSCYISP